MIYGYKSNENDFTYDGKALPLAYDVVVTRDTSYYVSGKYPLDDAKTYKLLKEGYQLKVHTPQGQRIFALIKPVKHDTYIEFEGWPLFLFRMRNKQIKPLSITNGSGQTALTAFMSGLKTKQPQFSLTSNISDKHDYNTQDTNDSENELYDAIDVFQAIVSRWQGEVDFNDFDIRMLDRIGKNSGALLHEEKNISEYVDETSVADLVTRIYAISEWEDNDQKKHKIEVTVDSPLIDSYDGIVYEKQYRNNDIKTEAELRDWANLKFSTDNMDKPKRNISVTTNIINGTSVSYGDTLVLNYVRHDVDMEIKVVGYTYDGYSDKYLSVELGSPKLTMSDTISNKISDVESNVTQKIKSTQEIIVNDLGKKIIHGGLYPDDIPQGNFKQGDTWFTDDGKIYYYDEASGSWLGSGVNGVVHEIETAISDNEQATQDAMAQANKGVADAEQARIDAGLAGTTASQAQADATSAQADVNDLGGTVTKQTTKLNTVSDTVDGHTRTISEVTTSLSSKASQTSLDNLSGEVDKKATITALNTVKNTADGNASSITTLRTDVDGKATIQQYNTLKETVDGNVTTIGNLSDGKADKLTVTEMADQFNVTVKTVDDLEKQVNWQTIRSDTWDLNALYKPGKYFIKGKIANTPISGNNSLWAYVVVEDDGTNVDISSGAKRIRQTFQLDSSNEVYFRRYNGLNWSSWEQQATKAQLTVLSDQINLRVQKGEIIRQLNLSTEGLLIDAGKVQITGDTYIENGVIKNAMIGNGQISSAKIADASITNAKIVNVDVSKLTAGTINANLIKMRASASGKSIEMDGNGIAGWDANGKLRMKWGIQDLAGDGQSSPSNLLFYTGNGTKSVSAGTNVDDLFVLGTESTSLDGILRFPRKLTIQSADLYLTPQNLTTKPWHIRASKDGSDQPMMYADTPNTGILGHSSYYLKDVFTYNGYIRKLNVGFGSGAPQEGDLKVSSDGGGPFLRSKCVYNRTASAGPNVYVTTGGELVRNTSGSKYKLNIAKVDDALDLSRKVISLDIKKWHDKASVEAYADSLNGKGHSGIESVKRYYGLIAEDVAKAGLDMLVEYGEDGEIEGLNYSLIGPMLIPIIKEQQSRIEKLEKLLGVA